MQETLLAETQSLKIRNYFVGSFLFLIYAIAGLARDVDQNVFLTPAETLFYGCMSRSRMVYLVPIWSVSCDYAPKHQRFQHRC